MIYVQPMSQWESRLLKRPVHLHTQMDLWWFVPRLLFSSPKSIKKQLITSFIIKITWYFVIRRMRLHMSPIIPIIYNVYLSFNPISVDGAIYDAIYSKRNSSTCCSSFIDHVSSLSLTLPSEEENYASSFVSLDGQCIASYSSTFKFARPVSKENNYQWFC